MSYLYATFILTSLFQLVALKFLPDNRVGIRFEKAKAMKTHQSPILMSFGREEVKKRATMTSHIIRPREGKYVWKNTLYDLRTIYVTTSCRICRSRITPFARCFGWNAKWRADESSCYNSAPFLSLSLVSFNFTLTNATPIRSDESTVLERALMDDVSNQDTRGRNVWIKYWNCMSQVLF